MQEIFDLIRAWPVIIQGALGSALFALLMSIFVKSKKYAGDKYSRHSTKSRITWLLDQRVGLDALLAKNSEERSRALVLMLYRGSRPATKAFIWLTFGLLMDAIFSMAGIVGYAVSIFYAMRLYSIVGPVREEGARARHDEICREYSALIAEVKNNRNPP